MRHRTLYVSVLGLLLAACPLFGQEFTGHVTDPSNAVVSKATIIVHNQLTNTDVTTVTTSSGDYTVPYLKPGLYTVSAQAGGFQKQNKTDIKLEVGKTATINFTLKVGSVGETVTVTSDALLDVGKADVGEVVENTRVTELPLNGRDPSTLAQLSAGVAWYGGKQWTRPFDQTEGALAINGGGEGNTVLMLDGVSNESPQGNAQVAYIPPVDAVQEFKIITNPYDAQFGRGQGGVIDMTLKSGTNALHGDVYEFARRTWMDSNTWVNNNTLRNGVPIPRAQHRQDQYGFELDGPVVVPKLFNGRDRAFFVLQFENWNEREPNTVTTSVPMAGWINGDFSNATYWDGQKQQPLIIYDPQTVVFDSNPNSPTYQKYVRQPFPNNKIPASRISQVAKNILSYYPAPNVAPRPGQNPTNGNYVVPEPIDTIYRNALAKVDYNLTSHDRFSLRFGYWERRGAWNQNGLSGPVARAWPNGSRNSTFATEEVHTFTPNLVLDFKAVVTTFIQINLGGAQGFDQTSLGLPSSLVSQYSGFNNYFPSLDIDSFASMGNQGGNISPAYALAMNPTLTWIKGRHSIHGGVDLRFLQQINKQVGGGAYFHTGAGWTQHFYNYGGAQTEQSGNSIASFLLGTPDNGNVSIGSPVYWSQHYFAPFIQDDWKLTNRLTLNLGVRYDLNGTQSERNNRGNYAFDTTSVNPVNAQVNQGLMPAGTQLLGGMTFLGVNGAPRTFIPMIKSNVQPRIGFAYALNEKTVIRGGYGMMFRNPVPGDNNLGFSANTQFVNSFDGGIHQSGNTLDNPFPTGIIQPTGSKLGLKTGLGQGLWFINPNYKTPRYENYSLGVERQFLKHDVINVTYSGSRSTRQDSADNINHVSIAAMEKCAPTLGGDPSSAACGRQSANPFFDVPDFQGSSDYSSTTLPASRFSRAFPEFSDITEYQLNEGRSWYNSLQVTATHKMGQDLTLHGTWTYSKNMTSGGFVDGNYRILSRTIDGSDVPHRITLSGVYMLPVGRNRRFLGTSNRLVDAVIGGWELASLYIFETGRPWSLNGNGLNYMHNASVPHRPDPSIPGSIRGAAPCAAGWTQKGLYNWQITPYPVAAANCKTSAGVIDYDFISQAPYAPNQNIVYSGIRIPNFHQIDANLSKNFHPTERFTVQLRLEAFNVANHPVFQQDYDRNPSDPQFGAILKQWGQTNVPRQGQIAVKVLW
ncbi:TonB-dependent receptor domain-containing protein [Edaphobacter bradus]|uniref:TonB-dependent receptor domain-containing protein n=1 Tax=Edaphobacter bradus TaxID=2259016 RepID=UPI0021DF6C98|nr:TonB-dependent receptor [Edaphobacter bradus]